MSKRDIMLVVRHSYAKDPNPAKVAAALDLWRRALAQKMASHPSTQTHSPASSGSDE